MFGFHIHLFILVMFVLKRRYYSQRFIAGNRNIISNYENNCKINTQFIEKEKLQFWPQWRWASVFGRCCWVRVMDFSRPNQTVCFFALFSLGMATAKNKLKYYKKMHNFFHNYLTWLNVNGREKLIDPYESDK